MKIKVGCCGYGYFRPSEYYGKDWKKKFKSVLAAYASKFDLVEVNSTFYKIPQTKTAAKWLEEARAVNEDFEFTVKAYQQITHIDRFAGKSLEVYSKMMEICEALDAKFLLFQSPAGFKPTEENVKNMKKFFKKANRKDLVFVWEPRGGWWGKVDLIKEICKEYNIVCCVDPLRNSYPWQKIAYFRLHGFGKPTMYNYKFSKEELKKVKEAAKKFKEAYVLFNNIYMYEQALEFLNL
jgi:uncharacterized protein YecE (DUF72 family)